MRIVLVLIAVALLLIESGSMVKPAAAVKVQAENTSPLSTFSTSSMSSKFSRSSTETVRLDFDTQVKPVFKSQCTPCHFSGGQMYNKLPFDRAETIKKLGVKVFTRIKGNDDRKLIEAFLSQQ